jgi:RNA polymerase sigma factor (sigma-70 family)
MVTATVRARQTKGSATSMPAFVFHPSFAEPGADETYGQDPVRTEWEVASFMTDEVTRECTKRMHYAGWRASNAASSREAIRWRQCYYACRDRIVLGNRKLTFRAVQKWHAMARFADDMVGEGQVVLIRAVAAFNPWMGIRFSTYAFTCLMRAYTRLYRRHTTDRMFRAAPLESLPHGEPVYVQDDESSAVGLAGLDKFLREEDPLLTSREKLVLCRRFHLNSDAMASETLEEVGRDLGLSKERIRQVQMKALAKLRSVLLPTPAMA